MVRSFSPASGALALSIAIASVILNPLNIFAQETGMLQGIQYRSTGKSLALRSTEAVQARLTCIAVDGIDRCILDLDNAVLGTMLPSESELFQQLSHSGLDVSAVSINQFSGTHPVVRIVIDTASGHYLPKLAQAAGRQIDVQFNEIQATSAPGKPAPGEVNLQNQQYQQALQMLETQKKILTEKDTRLAEVSQKLLSNAEASHELERVQRNYQSLQRQFETLKSQYAAITNQPQSSGHEAQLSEKLKQQEAVYQSLQQRMQSLTQEYQRALNSTQTDSDKHLADMTRKYDEMRQENQTLQSTITHLQQQSLQASQVQKKAIISDQELANLKNQLEQAKKGLSSAIQTIASQNSELSRLKAQFKTDQEGLGDTAKTQLTLINSKLEAKEEEVIQLQRKITMLVRSHSSTSEKTLASLDHADSDSEDYKAEYYDLKKQLENNQEQLKLLKKAHEAELSALKITIQERDQQLAQLGTNGTVLVEAVKSQPESIENQLVKNTSIQEIQTLKQTLVAMNRKYDDLSRENQALQQSLKQSKAQLTGQPDDAKILKKTLLTLNDRYDALQAKLNQSEKEAESLQTALAKIQPDKTAMPQPKEVTQPDKQSLQEKEKLKQENQRLAEALERANHDFQTQVSTLQEKLNLLSVVDTLSLPKTSSSLSSPSSPVDNTRQISELLHQAAVLREQKKYQDAIPLYRKAYALDSDNSDAVLGLTALMVDYQQAKESIPIIERYIASHPEDNASYNILGKAYLLTNQPDAAQKAFSQAISTSALNNYAATLKKVGRLQDAEQVFRFGLTLNPKDSNLLFNLGNLYSNANRPEQARDAYLEVLRIKPDSAMAHYNLALVYAKLGDKAGAVEHLTRYLKLEPTSRNADSVRTFITRLKS